MEEQQFSEKDSLELISKMISTAKNTFYESGWGCLLWGFANLFCFTLAYLATTLRNFKLPFNPFLLMLVAFLLQMYFQNKEKKYKSATSYVQDGNKYVWIAFGISVFALNIGAGFSNIGYMVFPPLLIIFAVPTFVSGLLMKFTPFIFGGIVCWILGIAAFFMLGPQCYLLTAAGATAAWIIPGFILRARFLRNRKTEYGV